MSDQNGESDPFSGRRSMRSGRESMDPFENMREQMEKDKEDFFNRGSNDWPTETGTMRGNLFNRPRTSLGGFSGGPGAATAGVRGGPRYSQEFPSEELDGGWPGQGARHQVEEDGSDHSSSSGGGGVHGEVEGVPIRVIHSRGGGGAGPQKQKYSTTRNTTELPAKTVGANSSPSPRLERASSEPPSKFSQRLNLAKPSSVYSTIPEGGESQPGRAPLLQDPRSSEPTRPGSIKPSASAPHVPPSTHEPQHPVPPPRRTPPRPNNMSQNPGLPTNSNNNVRHIPIFVEGRPEPIFNTKVQPQQGPEPGPNADLSFHKPSDYYPAGVQRVKGKDGHLTPETPQTPNTDPCRRVAETTGEPTTPLGPPPGPIAMGYIPAPVAVVEPTTPLGPPPGPIAMGYLPTTAQDESDKIPTSTQQKNKVTIQLPLPDPPTTTTRSTESPPKAVAPTQERKASKEPVINVVPIKVEQPRSRASSQEPALRPGSSPTPARTTPQPTESPAQPKDPKLVKLDKIKSEVEVLMEQIANFKGKNKKDKEYLYLDEMLTRHLIALDGIEPEGQPEIRQMRKESIQSVSKCASLLDEKVNLGGSGS